MTTPFHILVAYGTETGNAETCAGDLAKAVKAAGFAARVVDLEQYSASQLVDESVLFLITSTYGDGDAPTNAERFLADLEADAAPALPNLRFAVCGFGDTAYPNFCNCGKRMDARLEALGATRLLKRVDCDVDYEPPFKQYQRDVLAWCQANADALPKHDGGAAPAGLMGKLRSWMGGS